MDPLVRADSVVVADVLGDDALEVVVATLARAAEVVHAEVRVGDSTTEGGSRARKNGCPVDLQYTSWSDSAIVIDGFGTRSVPDLDRSGLQLES
jgi:hypothetical protein